MKCRQNGSERSSPKLVTGVTGLERAVRLRLPSMPTYGQGKEDASRSAFRFYEKSTTENSKVDEMIGEVSRPPPKEELSGIPSRRTL